MLHWCVRWKAVSATSLNWFSCRQEQHLRHLWHWWDSSVQVVQLFILATLPVDKWAAISEEACCEQHSFSVTVPSSLEFCPNRIAKENHLLAGLWYSSTEPDMTLFRKPMAQSLKTLHDEGIILLYSVLYCTSAIVTGTCTLYMHNKYTVHTMVYIYSTCCHVYVYNVHAPLCTHGYFCITTRSWLHRVSCFSALLNMWFASKGSRTEHCTVQWILWVLQLLAEGCVIIKN